MGVRALTWGLVAVALTAAMPIAFGPLAAAPRKATARRTTMDEVVAQAAASSGRAYVALEEQLRAGGQEAIDPLRRRLADPDPVNQLMARVLLAWIGGQAPECPEALEYLQTLERRLAKTPVGSPPPVAVAAELDDRFGPRVAECLALRLVKELDWPHWRVMGVLFYLRDQRVPGTTSALVRFGALTANDAWRKGAVEAIQAIQDPELRRKVDLERQRLTAAGQSLPAALEELSQ